jgi:hypothetical protein
MKMKTIFMLILLLLLSPMAITNAIPKNTSRFYYIGVEPIQTYTMEHWADDNQIVMKYTQTANLQTKSGDPVGTIAFDVMAVLKIDTLEATVSAKYVISLDSGQKIEGTMSGNENFNSGEVDVKFVGHGSINVQGTVYNEGDHFVLDGYSW